MGNGFLFVSALVFIASVCLIIVQAIWLNSAKVRLTRMDRRLDEVTELVHTIRRLGHVGDETSKPDESAFTPLEQSVARSTVLPQVDGLWLERIRARENTARPDRNKAAPRL